MLSRIVVLTFAALAIATTTHAESCSPEQYRAFNALDVDGDGGIYPIDIMKSIIRLRAILNGSPATPIEKIRLDVNKDKQLSNIDLLNMINMYSALNEGDLRNCQLERLRAFSIGDGHNRTLDMNRYQYWGVIYNIWSQHFSGENNLPPSISLDFNKDGSVDYSDVTILVRAFADRH